MIPTFHIGPLKLESPVLLAPMAGYTHLPFRLIARRLHAGLVYTELISVEGLARHAPQTEVFLTSVPGERPVAAHLYGHDPVTFAAAASRVEALGCFDLIDINAGCPVPKVMRRGAGAGLVKDPDRLHAIVCAVRAAVRLPVTVKTRIGPSVHRENALDLLHAAQEGGADAIAFHARFTADRHSGPAHWEVLSRIKAAARIPVIGNGSVKTHQDAFAMLEQTGVDAVMVGRAAVGNPWIFEQCYDRLHGRTPHEPSLEERRAVILEHCRGLTAFTEDAQQFRRRKKIDAEDAVTRHFRAHLIRYLSGLRGLTEMKRTLSTIHRVADVEKAVDFVIECHRRGGPVPPPEEPPTPDTLDE